MEMARHIPFLPLALTASLIDTVWMLLPSMFLIVSTFQTPHFLLFDFLLPLFLTANLP